MSVQSFVKGQQIVVEVRDRNGRVLFVEKDAIASSTDKWVKSLKTNRYVKAGESTTGGVSFFTPESYAGRKAAADYLAEANRIINEEPPMQWPELYHALADLIMEEQSSAPAVREQELADIQEVADEPELATA